MVRECAGFPHVQMSLRFSHICTQVRGESIGIKMIYYRSWIAATQLARHAVRARHCCISHVACKMSYLGSLHTYEVEDGVLKYFPKK
jgi:hypothetical protein